MPYIAKELLAKLICLTLVGKNEDGELEWAGSEEEWQMTEPK
jgi:hypothetical protein